jgi:hypothetical protein
VHATTAKPEHLVDLSECLTSLVFPVVHIGWQSFATREPLRIEFGVRYSLFCGRLPDKPSFPSLTTSLESASGTRQASNQR